MPPSPYKKDEKRQNRKKKKIKVLSTRWPRCQGPAVFSLIGVERRPLSRRSGRLGAGHQQEGQITVKAYETENLKGADGKDAERIPRAVGLVAQNRSVICRADGVSIGSEAT